MLRRQRVVGEVEDPGPHLEGVGREGGEARRGREPGVVRHEPGGVRGAVEDDGPRDRRPAGVEEPDRGSTTVAALSASVKKTSTGLAAG